VVAHCGILPGQLTGTVHQSGLGALNMIDLLLVYGTGRLISTLRMHKIRERDIKYLYINYFGVVSDKKYLLSDIFYP
jgi:hypothetical protein